MKISPRPLRSRGFATLRSLRLNRQIPSLNSSPALELQLLFPNRRIKRSKRSAATCFLFIFDAKQRNGRTNYQSQGNIQNL